MRRILKMAKIGLSEGFPLIVACGSCAGACPVGAISEGDGAYVIDENACVSCGTCAGACPMGAIVEG